MVAAAAGEPAVKALFGRGAVVNSTVNIQIWESSAAKDVNDIFYQWAMAQLPEGGLLTLPQQARAPDGGILLVGVPADILSILCERSIPFSEEPPAAGGADVTETDGDVRIGCPVKCPLCGRSWMMGLRPVYVAAAFNDREPIELYSACCDHRWNASEEQTQRIRGLLDRYEAVAGKSERR
jgi:hypothetical protein